jgi:hypothetical protein
MIPWGIDVGPNTAERQITAVAQLKSWALLIMTSLLYILSDLSE